MAKNSEMKCKCNKTLPETLGKHHVVYRQPLLICKLMILMYFFKVTEKMAHKNELVVSFLSISGVDKQKHGQLNTQNVFSC